MTARVDDAWQRFSRRMLARPSRDSWIGILVRVIPEATRHTRDGAARTPAHFLGAAWSPASEGLARFPEYVVIGSPQAGDALALLFDHLPGNAKLHLAGADDVDAALAAEILLVADRNLESYQRAAIARFAASERERVSAHIRRLYSDRDPAYERFQRQVTRGRA